MASTLALSLAGRRENGRAAAPVNAISHWIWDRPALRQDEPSVRHTATGYLVHHGASVFWGVLHARACGGRPEFRRPGPILASAAATAALACFVDYRMTPERLTPGFEHRLSSASMAAAYGCFALGLAAGALWLRRREEQDEQDAAVLRPCSAHAPRRSAVRSPRLFRAN